MIVMPIIIIYYFNMQESDLKQAQEKIIIRNGNYYQLIHKKTNLALIIEKQSSNKYDEQIPKLDKIDEKDVDQVWMIQNVRDQYSFELVHAHSTLILQNFTKFLKLTFGCWRSGQFFWIQSANTNKKNEFFIKDRPKSDLYLDGNSEGVALRQMNRPQQAIWILKIAEKNKAISSSVIIQNAFTNLVIDVPQASSKPEVKICQYTVNKRFNQRFQLTYNRDNKTYKILNSKSKLYLDVKGQSSKEGAYVIQYSHTNGLNQKWLIQNQGKDLYLIRTCLDNGSLCLGVKGNSMSLGANLVLSKEDDYTLWRIIGDFEKQQIKYV